MISLKRFLEADYRPLCFILFYFSTPPPPSLPSAPTHKPQHAHHFEKYKQNRKDLSAHVEDARIDKCSTDIGYKKIRAS